MGKIVLASSSPRRAELIQRVGLGQVKIVTPHVEESFAPDQPPEDIVAEWSRKKAADVAAHCAPDDLIIAADTVVWYDGNVLGKPRDADDATRMLILLSGDWHSVYTGVTVMRGDKCVTAEEITSVHLANLTTEEIQLYVATGEPLDKAGAYGIQDRGALLIDRIDGDFYNVMGLPVSRLYAILRDEFDMNILGGNLD